MGYGTAGGRLTMRPAVKHQVFVSYHHGCDQAYYDAFSSRFHDTYYVIRDVSLDAEVESDDVDYVMRRIREDYIAGSSCTIVLAGAETWRRKYVDWEIKATLDKEHGLIGAYLPGATRPKEDKLIVPGRLHDNIQSGFALFLSWQELTTSAAQLERYVNDAKSRDRRLINNSRARQLHNN
jgi:hypothetical protein